MENIITIDTDNAVIRFYVGKARLAGIPESALRQIATDLETLADGVSFVAGCRFFVEGVDP